MSTVLNDVSLLIYLKWFLCINKKAFLLNANRPLYDSPCFIVKKYGRGFPAKRSQKLNKCEHVRGRGLYIEVQVEQVSMCQRERDWG